MDSHTDFESALASTVPVACQIDPLNIMFQAGIEQERTKQKNVHRSFRLMSVACAVLLLSTCGLAVWNAQLTSRNLELAMAQKSNSPPKNSSAHDNNDNDDLNRDPTWINNDPDIPQDSNGAEFVRIRDRSKSEAKESQLVKHSDSEAASVRSVHRDSIFSMASGKNFERMMMRGVTFSDAETYRDARFVKTDLSTVIGNRNDTKSNSTVSLPYMILRDQINQGEMGL